MRKNWKSTLKTAVGLLLIISAVAPLATMAEDMPGWRPDMPGWRPWMPGIGNNPLDGSPPVQYQAYPFYAPYTQSTPGCYVPADPYYAPTTTYYVPTTPYYATAPSHHHHHR